MIRSRRLSTIFAGTATAFALVAFAPGSALAQEPPAAAVCDVDETRPAELGRAFLPLNGILGDTNRTNVMQGVKNVMNHANTNIERALNMAGRNYIMARALIAWANVGAPINTTRGELGIPSQPNESVDVIVAIDSLLTSVEQSNPNCADEIQNSWRFHNVWVQLLTQATSLMQADNTDSAEKVVNRAQLLERKTPYTWQMLASIATRRDDQPKAIEHWKKTYEAAGSDTSVAEMKYQALYFIGENNLGMSTQKSGAEAVAFAEEAANYFRRFLAEAGKHRDAPAARANLATAYMAAGDTARVAEVYAPLLAQPSEFTSQDHMQSGVAATQAKRYEDAVKLFGFALVTAPHDRDILYNLSVSLVHLQQFAALLDPATRLVNIDPNGIANLEMLAYAYASMERLTVTDTTLKKQYADSLSKYNPMYEALLTSHNVVHTMFSKTEQRTVLSGYIENKGPTDRAFKLDYDFLDRAGTTITSGSADVGVVKAGGQAEFRIEVPQGGIQFYKGKLIPPPM